MIDWPITVNKNKYSQWYEQLIQKAQARPLDKSVYTEGHHIIPKSWGGCDKKSNIVRLLPREHYIAHALLWKMDVPRQFHIKMTHAFNAMSIMKDGSYNKPGYRINSRLFELVRLERIEYLRSLKGPLNPRYGKPSPVTPEGKARQIAAVKERWADPEYRKNIIEKRKAYYSSEEGRAKIKALADSRRGVKRDPAIIEKGASKRRGKKATELFSEQALANIAEGIKHRVYTPEGKAKLIETARANGKKPKSEEHKRKISESNKKHDRWWTRGENNPNYGKKWSEEKKKAMSEAKKGIKSSPEQVEKQRLARLAASKDCEYCGKFVDPTNYKRWHGPKCKLANLFITK